MRTLTWKKVSTDKQVKSATNILNGEMDSFFNLEWDNGMTHCHHFIQYYVEILLNKIGKK